MSMTLATTIVAGVIGGYGIVHSKASLGYEVACIDSNSPNLVNNYDENNMLCKKLEYDKRNNVTKLDCGLEKQLNEAGVFDSELEDLDSESIEELENSKNISVNISYTTAEGVDGEKEELTNEEISSLISDSIEKGDMAYEEIYSNNLLAKIGVVPTVAYADVYNKKEDTDNVSKSGAVKHVLICSQNKKGSKIVNVTYKATWLKESEYRNKDVVGVTFKNSQLEENSWSCKHTAKKETLYINNRSTSTEDLKTNPKNCFDYVDGGTGITCKVDLFGNRASISAKAALGVYESYKNETIELKFRVKAEKKKTNFTTHYFHTKTELTVEPAISFGKSGISVSATPGAKNYSEEITNRVYMQYKLK